MNKYTFLVYHAGYEDFLKAISGIGVVHIETIHKELTPEIQELYRQLDNVRKSIKKLEKTEPDDSRNGKPCFENGKLIYERVKIIEKELEYNRHQMLQVQKELKQVEPWGNFDWDTIRVLEEKGIKLRFYNCRESKYNPQWEQQFTIRKIDVAAGVQYFVRIDGDHFESQIDDEIYGADEITLPKKTLNEIKENIRNLEKEERELNRETVQIAQHCKDELVSYSLELQNAISEKNAKLQTIQQVDGMVDILEGWVPETKKTELDEYLEQHNILHISEKA
ncbi:MAG: hypothetical protein FWG22_03460, partial [Prolixibacteraceae bacterium]|nr:hypothetical protein [Prolixibacteraceae bacterium]